MSDIIVEEEEHARVGSFFLGPHGENGDFLKDILTKVVAQHVETRHEKDDGVFFITKDMQERKSFTESMGKLNEALDKMINELSGSSVPFWSPRYNGHMNMDTTLPSIVGYIAAMLYNQNNAAPEGGPVTTKWEMEAGRDLCLMLGYQVSEGNAHPDPKNPGAWGHITCGGSVANLEGMWAMRNLKFYPLSLRLAMEINGPLNFLAQVQPPFQVSTGAGTADKDFISLSAWELMNLPTKAILDIPANLNERFSISSEFLDKELKPYLVQTVGKDYLERKFNLKPGKFFISKTRHYSWDKASALTGIGSENLVYVKVDDRARMSRDDLDQHLGQCIDNQIPVFGVVAIMGSTEHGACDPLEEVISLKNDYLTKGLSGYVNYPAGGLCYRDLRMRNLITWTSPYIFREGDANKSMGVYGVEGSKPGAAAAAAVLSHKMIGLTKDKGHYKRLLGEALFTSTKLYCHWVTLSEDELIVTPFLKLPEKYCNENCNGDDCNIECPVKTFKDRIRKEILDKTNRELLANPDAKELIQSLVGDLMINAFACNFKVGGAINTDTSEASRLNEMIFQRCSITDANDTTKKNIPLILTSSVFGEEDYGDCLKNYKKRLGLIHNDEASRGDITFLVNVTMSPWPTDPNFLQPMVDEFKKVAKEEIEHCVYRCQAGKDKHTFVLQGVENIYLVHVPKFHLNGYQSQMIFSTTLPADAHERYKKLRAENPKCIYGITSQGNIDLDDILKDDSQIRWDMCELGDKDFTPLDGEDGFLLRNTVEVLQQSLKFNDMKNVYPDKMLFYLYGSNDEVHIDHVLDNAPNFLLSTDRISLNCQPRLDEEFLKGKLVKPGTPGGLLIPVVAFETIFERSLHPLNEFTFEPEKWNFETDKIHRVSIYTSYDDALQKKEPKTTGFIRIDKAVFSRIKDLNDWPNKKEN
ncbi:hypothetical protein MKX08_001136 [Trichoderma sp. CBMAI-0020]|nr:hypothetical protein MKX08_001136 [Trichoderma sp. CBMAI-0020]